MKYPGLFIALLQLDLILVSTETPIPKKVCCPDTITMESKGWSVVRWGRQKLGVYSLMRCDEDGNGVYEHAFNNRFFLYRLSNNEASNNEWQRDVWMVGDKVDQNFGWIMHMYCDYKCPSDCPNRLWRYWNGTTRGVGSWERDENFKVKQGASQKDWMLGMDDEMAELNHRLNVAQNHTNKKLDDIKSDVKSILGKLKLNRF